MLSQFYRLISINKLLLPILFQLVLSAISNSYAGTTEDSLLATYSKKLTLHKHFTAEFTQSRHMEMFKKPLISTGTISFSYPDKILFHYKTPFESIILFSEGSMKRYRIENGKYIEQPSLEIVAKAITKEIMRYLRGEFTKDFPYEIRFNPAKPRQFILIPISSIAKTVFSSIELSFPENLLYIEQIKLVEQSGDYILIKHEAPSFEQVPDSLFTVPYE